MDYEKLYKNALERAKSFELPEYKNIMVSIFPELAESEDEKIRKALIEMVHDTTGDELWVDYNVHKEEALAWLEKQGKSSDQIHYWTEEEIEPIINDYLRGVEHYGGMIGRLRCLKPKSLEKQGEQKPILDFKASNWYVSKVDGKIRNIYYSVDKVEPKFKVGDFIVNDYCMGRVIEITNDAYLLDTGQGIPFSCEHNVHLWTIQDAKDGDVLAAHECLVLFRKIDGLNIRCYCTYHFMNNPSFYVDTLQNKDAFLPATKEQCDTLMKAMNDAGYTFDFEKKELKKIEQNPAWSEEDERMCQETIDWFEKKCFPYALEEENPAKESIKWLKSLKERIGG